ncbi:hypothetical protein COCSADRAFT_202097 [Bipolaris sorokiniana ND90Pr]|uniref:6-phosphogluconate dehydrogenase NADP-binding domain-containing protein n=1 Tax=Cochliobolus sativus (strain ND90Pr / ATCC 201652) TaxID=665912 RepID=M2SY37_COCSN|nr:uncharacterized protein COCSADRAFT_202097 [Bipolaris sorokiniana ND90Pr]EMD61717.1 hypothetical protein COCSADRAFT_202097 [Bipolaris sorokiniana ND90Pr]
MDSSEKLHVGWIGLGSMGLAMATNIQKHIQQHQDAYPQLKYWNRTISRGKPLEELGATACATVADLVQTCNVIFISVSDDTAITTLTTTIQNSGPLSQKIIIDTTTVHPSTTTIISTSFTQKDASYISAPVFGATPVAIAGQLLIAVAGPPQAITRVTPLLKGVLARRVLHVGDEASQAMLLKTTSNFITAGLMTLLSEAHVLAETSGLAASTLESLIEENFGAYALGVSRRLTSGSYLPAVGQAPASGLELGIKDVGHGVVVARGKGVELRIGEMYLEAAEEAKGYAEGRGRRADSSAVYGVLRQRAGLGFESEVVRRRDGHVIYPNIVDASVKPQPLI